MSMRKTVVASAVAWVALVGLLHSALNLDLFRRTERGEGSFRVGFLPVT